MSFNIEKKGYKKDEVDLYIAELKKTYEGALAQQKQRISELKNTLSEAEKSVGAYRQKSALVTKAIYSAVSKAEEIEKLAKLKYDQEIEQLKSFHDKWVQYYDEILKKYPLDDDLTATAGFNKKMAGILSQKGREAQLNKVFDSEDKRLGETQIGYVRIKTNSPFEQNQEDLLREIIPDIDPESSILSNIDDDSLVLSHIEPIDKIKSYLDKASAETETQIKPQMQKKDEYKDRSSSGFSFEEAMNPKEDLKDIMKELGFLTDEQS